MVVKVFKKKNCINIILSTYYSTIRFVSTFFQKKWSDYHLATTISNKKALFHIGFHITKTGETLDFTGFYRFFRKAGKET